MAYKYSRGAFVASGSVTLEEGLSVTGSSTLAAVTATTISGTTVQFTTISASNLGGAAVSGLSAQYIPSWDAGLGRFENSFISRTGFGKTIISGALGLDVTGNVAVTSGFVSASNGLLAGSESTLNNLTVNGNLTVKGTTTTVQSTILEISDANIVISSGSTTSLAANNAGITVGSTGYQLKFVSGSAGALSDSWQFSGSGGFTDIRAGIVTATSFIGSIALSITEQPDGSATLAKGVNYMTGTLSTPRTWTLPASPVIGDSVRVKAPSNCGNGVGQYILTVSASGAHLIDGEGTAPLESPYAAIECVYVANNKWSIF